MSWTKVKLADVTEYITDGDHQPAPKSETGVLFVKIKDIQNNKVVFDNALFVPQQYYDRLPQNRKAVNGDTLYTVVGSYGIPAFVNHDIPFCFERNIALLHPNSRVVPQYLYYAVKNPAFYEYANNIANGSAQKLIPLSKLASMEIAVPPLEIQKKIADFLSIYDDLIEINQKQIKLLEEAAQRLYKEWFVDLRFPGYETTPFTDGIPEGWVETTIGEETEVRRGGSPRPIQEYLSDEGLNWLKISDATASNSPFIYQIKEKIKSEGLKKTVFMKAGAIILSNSATPGIPKILKIDTCIHDGWLYFPDLQLSNEYMYHLFLQIRSDLVSRATGAVFTNLRTDILKGYRFVKPDDYILDLFNKQVKPIFLEIDCLHQQVLLLTEARDRLLPKLMNGEIEV